MLSIFAAGIATNTAKPAGYSVRMEASVPLVTQAPPIQPLQIRPGVITQVKGVARMEMMVIETQHRLRLRDSLSFLVSVDLVNTLDVQSDESIERLIIKWNSFAFQHFQQAWPNRAQQILVPTWQQVTSVPPPPTTLASDTVVGSQRLGDWG